MPPRYWVPKRTGGNGALSVTHGRLGIPHKRGGEKYWNGLKMPERYQVEEL